VQALNGLGATRFAEGRAADAVASLRRAVAIGDRLRSTSSEVLYYLARCHVLLGGVAGATRSGLSAEEGEAELGRAMDTLRRAVAAGYRSVDWMRRDPDLGALRSRPDFQLLMADLAFPTEPFARGD
jgi:hypothetical protein